MKFLVNFSFSLLNFISFGCEPSVWGIFLIILCSSWAEYDDAVSGFSSLQDILEGTLFLLAQDVLVFISV